MNYIINWCLNGHLILSVDFSNHDTFLRWLSAICVGSTITLKEHEELLPPVLITDNKQTIYVHEFPHPGGKFKIEYAILNPTTRTYELQDTMAS